MLRWRIGHVPCLDENVRFMIVDEMMICLFRWMLGHNEIHTLVMMRRVDDVYKMSYDMLW